jgi:chromosome segregation ATPase
MQALVAEVRQLRKDLQTASGYSLKTEILLHRLQVQEAAVARVAQHLNDVRSNLSETQGHRRDAAANLKQLEEFLESSEISPEVRKQVERQISGKKSELESLTAEEQQKQTAETEAEEQLRTEQAKLSALEDRVDRLEEELGTPR